VRRRRGRWGQHIQLGGAGAGRARCESEDFLSSEEKWDVGYAWEGVEIRVAAKILRVPNVGYNRCNEVGVEGVDEEKSKNGLEHCVCLFKLP
jgi:hypothetical protein